MILSVGLLLAAGRPSPASEPAPPGNGEGYLGIAYRSLTPKPAPGQNQPAQAGVLITEVRPQFAAAAAGLREKDIIVEFDGKAVTDDASFAAAFRPTPPGKTVVVKFLRDGQPGTANLTVAATPPDVVLYRRAATKAAHGDLPGAIADYTEAIRLDPTSATSYLSRGMARANSDDPKGAIADYTEAIRLDPTSVLAFLNRGLAKANSGDAPGAIADYSEAIRLDPASGVAFFNRGVVKANHGDPRGAIADYTETIRLDPTYAPAFLNRGLARTNDNPPTGRRKLSKSETQAAQKRAAEAAADYTEARRLYTEAIQARPDNVSAHLERAVAREKLGDASGAAQDRATAANLKAQSALAEFQKQMAEASLPGLLAGSDTSVAYARERNHAIIAAKNKQLPVLLREKRTEELSDLVVKIEQTVLDLDHNAEMIKDRAQQAVATNVDQNQVEELRGLAISYRERIELLKPILATIKEEIANRSR